MRIGVPREVKDHEARVAITPAGVRELTGAGHEVVVERDGGRGSSIADADYEAAGARIAPDAAGVWGEVDLVCKVKEPVASEYEHLRDDLTLFTYLHLAADEPLTRALRDAGTLAVAYETVVGDDGGLPLLAPMSEVAGRMAPQVGAACLEKERGGRGVLLGGVSGVAPGHVVVIGAGTAGRNAAWLAAGMEARVTVLDLDLGKLRYIDSVHKGRITTLASNTLTLEGVVAEADLVIGAVLVPGALAPRVITEEMVASMRPGAVLVDISIDQGGCAETSHVTSHSDPTYVVHDVVHYAVGNMPGAVPHTSTYALTNVTLPYLLRLADDPRETLRRDRGLRRGVNVADGHVTDPGVADAHGLDHTDVRAVLDLEDA
ncbi:alanine dehydrogenase [Nitriliruptoraceae bacterium ZYF776]|nr:alanine dehydrogenase [Profundirhabdus halotolerans]